MSHTWCSDLDHEHDRGAWHFLAAASILSRHAYEGRALEKDTANVGEEDSNGCAAVYGSSRPERQSDPQ